MINLCGILVELLRRWYKQIYQYYFQTPFMILNTIDLKTRLDRAVEPRTKNENKLEKIRTPQLKKLRPWRTVVVNL